MLLLSDKGGKERPLLLGSNCAGRTRPYLADRPVGRYGDATVRLSSVKREVWFALPPFLGVPRYRWLSRSQLFTMSRDAPRNSGRFPAGNLRTAARLFQQRGYDATSMNDVAAALKLSKGGLYHHFQSKDEILFEIMNHAMEITQERVLNPVRGIADPEERLRALIRLHIEVVLSPRDREITVMLHENHPLPPTLRKRINTRKKEYIHFVESVMADVQRARASERRGQPARRGIRSARHDQLDLPVVQAGRRPADEQSDSAIH